MGHGTKPYGRSGPYETIYAVQDMGELAVRLGCPVSHDRRGNVIFWDGFESSINKWVFTAGGLGSALDWSAEYARTGGFSLRLTIGSAGAQACTADARVPYPVLGRMGLEASWNTNILIQYWYTILDLGPGGANLRAALRYDAFTPQLEYQDAGGAWQVLDPALNLRWGPNLFHTIKVVGDFVNGAYVRAIVNNNAYPMPGIPLAPSPLGANEGMQARLQATSVLAANSQIWVDDVIITQNEP